MFSQQSTLFPTQAGTIPVNQATNPADEILSLVMEISVAEAEKAAIELKLKSLNDKLIAIAAQEKQAKEEQDKQEKKRQEDEKAQSEKANKPTVIATAVTAIADEKQIDVEKQKSLNKYFGMCALAIGFDYKVDFSKEAYKKYKIPCDIKLNENPNLVDLAVALEDFIVIAAENQRDKYRSHLNFFKFILSPYFDVKDKTNSEVIDDYIELLKKMTEAKKNRSSIKILAEWSQEKTSAIIGKIHANQATNREVKQATLSLFQKIIEEIKIFLGLKVSVQISI